MNYPGNEKPDQTVTGSQIEAGDKVLVENPKRPGYVFQGWVIPSADGTEAIDQELVYQDEADGKWYVDASKLPGYAGDDGRVELTARWTAALSVDAPISATFMYDLSQWDGSQARDAYVEGSSTVKNRSAVPIRVSGIESSKGGSASVLKKADGTALDDAAAARAAKVLSVFPTASDATGTEGDAKAPASDDAADDMAHKVDLSLDDVLLERSFDADAWAVDAATVGDNGVTVSTGDLKLGYRLNLGGSTGVTLDQDALLAVTGEPEGAGPSEAAPIANLAYCFAAEGLLPTGTKADPLWVEVTDPEVGGVGVYGLSDIKRAADDFSARVDPSTDPNDWDSIKSQISGSPYAKLFIELLEGGAPFKLKVGSSWQNIQILGICQDTRSSDGRKAGLSFGFQDVWAGYGKDCLGNAVATYINPDWQSQPGLYGWAGGQPLRDTYLRGTFANLLDVRVRSSIAEVWKTQQKAYGESASSLQRSKETIFLPSLYEVEGRVCKDSRPDFSSYTLNAAERYTVQGSVPFQYQLFKKGSASNPKVKHWQGAAKPWYTRSAQSFNYNGAGNQNWIWCIMRSDGSPQVAGCYDVEFATIVPAFCL